VSLIIRLLKAHGKDYDKIRQGMNGTESKLQIANKVLYIKTLVLNGKLEDSELYELLKASPKKDKFSIKIK
jgi:hypothetical protein